MNIKKFLKENIFTYRLYNWGRKLYQKSVLAFKRKRNKKLFEKRGANVLVYMQRLFEKQPNLFYFDFGTLLGVVRDGKLIPSDMDIDIAVYAQGKEIDSICSYLVKNHCRHIFRYLVEEIGVVEDSFIYGGIRIDVCYYRAGESEDLSYLIYDEMDNTGKTIRLSCPHVAETCLMKFNQAEIAVPQNPEKYLLNRYGKTWTIPDDKFIYWVGPSATKITNVSKCVRMK